jgi:hypothetical protein
VGVESDAPLTVCLLCDPVLIAAWVPVREGLRPTGHTPSERTNRLKSEHRRLETELIEVGCPPGKHHRPVSSLKAKDGVDERRGTREILGERVTDRSQVHWGLGKTAGYSRPGARA